MPLPMFKFACRFCVTLAAFFVCLMAAEARETGCPASVGNPAGSYLVPGGMTDIKYRGDLTLDSYAPAGTPRRAAILIHGGQGDKSTHLTQAFEVLERAGFAWFSVNYRNLDDVRAAVKYVRCPPVQHRRPPGADRGGHGGFV